MIKADKAIDEGTDVFILPSRHYFDCVRKDEFKCYDENWQAYGDYVIQVIVESFRVQLTKLIMYHVNVKHMHMQ